jgi:cytoplasmic iron level regulating protein YaaA (DUF328/UPF0246 family)
MKPLYLIACSNKKLDRPAQASELYQGQAFKFAMRVAERAGAEVIILSASYGILFPEEVIEPYNHALCNMTKAGRAKWARQTRDLLKTVNAYDREITVLAGALYASAVEGFPNVRLPLKGLGIGQQLQTLKHLGE